MSCEAVNVCGPLVSGVALLSVMVIVLPVTVSVATTLPSASSVTVAPGTSNSPDTWNCQARVDPHDAPNVEGVKSVTVGEDRRHEHRDQLGVEIGSIVGGVAGCLHADEHLGYAGEGAGGRDRELAGGCVKVADRQPLPSAGVPES